MKARVGQQGTLTRIRAPRGSRPRAPRDTRYTWAFACSLGRIAFAGSLFGAVCPERGTTAALVMPHANTAAMNATSPGSPAPSPRARTPFSSSTALAGMARRRFASRQHHPAAAPPCAPERNPVENVWAYLRANRLANAVFETCEEIVARCCDAWNFFANDSGHRPINHNQRLRKNGQSLGPLVLRTHIGIIRDRIMVSTTDCLSLPCCGWRAPHRRGAIFRRRSANGRAVHARFPEMGNVYRPRFLRHPFASTQPWAGCPSVRV